MDLKLLSILMLSINIVFLMMAHGCDADNGFCSINVNSPGVQFFFRIDPNSGTGGVELEGNYSNAISKVTQQQSSGVAENTGVFNILDGLKMILAFITYFTPFPILVFFGSLGIPTLYILVIMGPIFVLWSIALAYFIRGGGS